MAKFTIDEHAATHSSGSKFYKIYMIRGPDGSAVVTHWGKTSANGSLDEWMPANVGQSSLSTGLTGKLAAEKALDTLRAKTKRGYLFLPSRSGEANDIAEFKALLGHFSPDMANDILNSCAGGAVLPGGGMVGKAPKPKKVEIVIDRGEAWASW